jgi:hypothetical protein
VGCETGVGERRLRQQPFSVKKVKGTAAISFSEFRPHCLALAHVTSTILSISSLMHAVFYYPININS